MAKKLNTYKFILAFILVLSVPQYNLFGEQDAYNVLFVGVDDSNVLESLQAASQLQQETNKTPISRTALKKRAEADIDNLLRALHSFALFNATIQCEVDNDSSIAEITYKVDCGPIYPFKEFNIVNVGAICTFPFSSIELEALGIAIGTPAYPEIILSAEELLLKVAAENGYPQFRIIERHVVADQHEKNLSVTLDVDSGPQTTFGGTSISGNSTVDEDFIRNKIAWQEGTDYNPEDITKTRKALEKTGLFSSTSITYKEPEEGQSVMPMEIELIEAKHRTVAAGLGYNTQRGVGVTAEWEHRNIRGRGERVNVQASLWSDAQRLKAYYVLPDFGKVDQSLLWQAGLEHETTKGYSDSSLGLSAQIDSKINSELRLAYGLAYKSIFTTNSDNNRNFNLLKVPLHIRWSNANSLLDPTLGGSVNLKIAPTLQIVYPQFAYCPTTLTSTYYQPLTEDHRFVVAAKFSVGSIFGSKLERIPPSERFYAGGDNNLRGYRYQTVSPLDNDNKPIGGRSLMILSLEGRVRISEKFGFVAFYEMGNVYKSSCPQLGHKQLQTVGAGLRYHTPVGPIRLDVAVPLNPRKGLDSNYQIYMSIGQSF